MDADVPEVEVEEVDEPPPAPPPAAQDEDEWSTRFNPYGIMSEEKARADWQAPRPADPREDDGTYDVGTAQPPPAPPKTLTEYYEEDLRKKRERMARAGEEDEDLPERHKRRRPTFALAFGRELFLFPFYAQTIRAWLTLGVTTLFVLAFVRVVVVFWPT